MLKNLLAWLHLLGPDVLGSRETPHTALRSFQGTCRPGRGSANARARHVHFTTTDSAHVTTLDPKGQTM